MKIQNAQVSLYNSLIVGLYKNPLNKRKIARASATASGANITCGDHVRIYLKIKNGKILDAAFEGEGCAIFTSAASLITENAKGKSTAKILKWDKNTVFKLLGAKLSAARIKCGLLALETMQLGISAISESAF